LDEEGPNVPLVTLYDDFNDGELDPDRWVLPPDLDDPAGALGGLIDEQGGVLNFALLQPNPEDQSAQLAARTQSRSISEISFTITLLEPSDQEKVAAGVGIDFWLEDGRDFSLDVGPGPEYVGYEISVCRDPPCEGGYFETNEAGEKKYDHYMGRRSARAPAGSSRRITAGSAIVGRRRHSIRPGPSAQVSGRSTREPPPCGPRASADTPAASPASGGWSSLRARTSPARRGRTARAMPFRHPTASLATMPPLRAKTRRKAGRAVRPCDFAPTATGPSTTWLAVALATTRGGGPRPAGRSGARRRVSPSRVAARPSVGRTASRTQAKQQPPQAAGSSAAETRPEVSGAGMPWGGARNRRGNASSRSPKVPTATQVSAPPITAQRATVRRSSNR